MKLIKINIEDLYHYLAEMESPVMEIQLLRKFPGEVDLARRKDRLYSLHFSLFHALYLLKGIAGEDGYYIHLDPMRIRMIKVPGSGRCSYYYAEKGLFCNRHVEEGSYCTYHISYSRQNSSLPVYDPLDEFYCNPDNIAFGNSRILERLMMGIKVYTFRKGDIEESLKLFGLTHPGKRIIQKRYRELALKYHPDRNNGDDSRMKNLNNAYNVLKEVFIL